jgi:hypothetical protein
MRRLALLVAVVAAVTAGTAAHASGYWLSADTAHSARATAAVLPPGLVPAAATASGNTVTISFDRAVAPPAAGGLVLTRYRMTRYPAGADTAAGQFDCDAGSAPRAVCAEDAVPDGSWRYTDTPLLGNWIGAPSPAGPAVRVDTTGPLVTVTSPAQATRDRDPLITGTAGTLPGDLPSVLVRIYAGARLLQTRTAVAHAGSWQLRAGKLAPNARYTVRVSQRDSLDNLGESASQFVLDTVAPKTTLDPPAPMVGATPAFTGTAGDAVASATTSADSPTVTVRIYAGSRASGRPVQTLSAARDGRQWRVQAAPLASGRYTVRAGQSDAAGNACSSLARSFTVDATGPAVTIGAPLDGSATSTPTPTVTGTAGTAPGDLRPVTITVYAGTGSDGTPLQRLATVAEHGRWSVRLAPLAPNLRYTVQAVQADARGNLGLARAAFVLDMVAPQPSLDAPAAGTRTGGMPSFTGHAGSASWSPTTGADSVTVTVLVYPGSVAGGAPVQQLTAAVSGGSYQVTSTGLASGRYTAVASQRDAAGNVGSSAASTFDVDSDAPVVTLRAPGGDGGSPTPPLAGAAGTAAGDSATVVVTLYRGDLAAGSPVRQLDAVRTGESWAVQVLYALPGGRYTAIARQADAAGNIGASTAWTFTVAGGAPSPAGG